MKKLLLLAVVLFILTAAPIYAACDSTTGSGGAWSSAGTWQSGSVPGSTDTAIVLNGDTVTIGTSAGASDTTVLVLFVREGGVVDFDSANAGARFHCASLWLGDAFGAPFSSLGGGKLYLWQGDTIGIWNYNILGADDFNFRGTNCLVQIKGDNASTRAVVMGLSGSSRPYIYDNQSNGVFTATWAKFMRLGAATATPGITLDGNRGNTLQTVENCIFDSCGIYFNGDNENFKNDSFYIYHGMFAAIGFGSSSSDDTVQSCYIYCNHGNNSASNSPNGIELGSARSVVVISNNIIGVNWYTGGDFGPSIGIYASAADLPKIDGNYVTGWTWGFEATTGDSGRVTNNTFYNNGHISIAFLPSGSDSPVGWRVAGNTAFDGFRAGYPLNTYYGNASTGNQNANLVLAYNTFVAGGSGYPWHFGDGGSGGFKYTGVVAVGNLFINVAAEWRFKAADSVEAASGGWSSNYFDSLVVEATAQFDTTTNSTGGTNTSGNTPYFVDSANGDFRLDTGSALLGVVATAADTAWCDSFFTSPNYNIGYYQGTGVEPAGASTTTRRRRILLQQSEMGPVNDTSYRVPEYATLLQGDIGVVGDATGNGEVTSADIIKLAGYVFRGQPAPFADSTIEIYTWDKEVTADDRLITGNFGAVFLTAPDTEVRP